MPRSPPSFSFPHPAPTDIYTLSLHDALPISPVTLKSTADNDFLITPTQLEASINEHTRLLILNSPSNPSGQAYSRKQLEALGDVLLDHPRIIICTDDIYEHIWWGDEPFCTLTEAVPALAERTVVVNGVSKAYAMTGWRIGFAAGPAAIIGEMKKIQGQDRKSGV